MPTGYIQSIVMLLQSGSYSPSLRFCGICGALPSLTRRTDSTKRLDAQGKQLVEVHRSQGVVRVDRDLFLQKERTGIEALIRPEDRQARFGLSVYDGPVDGAGPPVAGKQGGMVLDGPLLGMVQNGQGHDVGHEGHDVEVGSELLVLLEYLGSRATWPAAARECRSSRPAP